MGRVVGNQALSRSRSSQCLEIVDDSGQLTSSGGVFGMAKRYRGSRQEGIPIGKKWDVVVAVRYGRFLLFCWAFTTGVEEAKLHTGLEVSAWLILLQS